MVTPYPPLPDRARLIQAPSTARHVGDPDGSVVLGGSPFRMLRLRPDSAAVVDTLFAGASLDEVARRHGRSVRAVEQLARRLLVTGMADPDWSGCDRPSPDEVTVVVPIKGRAPELRRLLSALTTAGHPGVRIVVVDDGSDLCSASDDLSGIASEFNARYCRHETSLGPAAARTTGLALVTTPLVAFVDSDVVVEPGWLDALLAHLADPAVAVVAPRVASAPGDSLLQRYETVRSPLDLGPVGGYVMARTRLAYVPAAVLVGRVDVLRDLGSFDSTLRVGEDVDLIWRLGERGYLVRYEPKSIAFHDPRTTLSMLLRQRADYGASAATLNKRHPGNVKPVSANRWSYLVWFFGAFGGWPGIIAGFATATTTAALLPAKLPGLRDRRRIGFRLAARGHLGMGRLLANAVFRAWLPIFLVASVVSRRCRRVVLASALVPPMIEWFTARPGVDPVRWVALRCLDDAAYGMGVWKGSVAERSLDAILPDVTNWPSSTNTSQDEGHGSGI